MRMALRAIWVVFIACAIWLAPATAQEHKGLITGVVTDPAHLILEGASVELQPTGKKAVSDNAGQFRIVDVPPGTYTLTISFLGMAAYTKEITVTAGQATQVEAAMQIASASESVTVTAEQAHADAEAINRERTAENILQ